MQSASSFHAKTGEETRQVTKYLIDHIGSLLSFLNKMPKHDFSFFVCPLSLKLKLSGCGQKKTFGEKLSQLSDIVLTKQLIN